MSRTARLALAAAALALAALPNAASARNDSGGSDNGDSYLNDSVKNPRFIEPYAWADPSRYRISHPQEGYGERQRAARGFQGPYGRVRVQPYGYDDGGF